MATKSNQKQLESIESVQLDGTDIEYEEHYDDNQDPEQLPVEPEEPEEEEAEADNLQGGSTSDKNSDTPYYDETSIQTIIGERTADLVSIQKSLHQNIEKLNTAVQTELGTITSLSSPIEAFFEYNQHKT